MQLGKYIQRRTTIFSRIFSLLFFILLLSQGGTTAHAATSDGCTVNNPTIGFSSAGLQNGSGGCVVTSASGQRVYDSSSTGYIITNDNNGSFEDNKGNKMTNEADKWCTTASTCISSVVYVFTVGLASSLAYVGSSVFNIGVQMSLQSAAYSQIFLTSGWGAARDIANMLFIFILIYIAVTIIYSAETHGTMKTLAAVVVMALLINFSFFITRVVVDAGNILAVQFYNAIPATPLSQTATQGSVGASVVNTLGLSPGDKKDLTYHFMDVIKVQKLLGQDSFKKFTDQNGFMTNVIVQITVYIMVGWIFAILALAFFAVGFKFIIRIIILWFVIIAAPLAFAMRAFASNDIARKLYNEWQSALLKFSFYPAIFLFILLIMIYIMKEMGRANGLIPDIFASLLPTTSGGTEAPVALGGALAIVLIRLGFVVIMLLFGLKAADQLVLHGSSQAEKFTGWASGKVMGWAENKRFTGLAYRASVGRAANMANKSVEGAKWASQPGVGGWFGTGLRTKVLAPMANKGFGGTRSFPQVLKDRDARLNERKAQLSKINDKERNDARKARVKSLIEKLTNENLKNVTKEEIRLIESLSKPDWELLGTDNAAKVARFAVPETPYANMWNDRKNRMVSEIPSFTADGQTKIHSSYQDALDEGRANAEAEAERKKKEKEKEENEKRIVASQTAGLAGFKGDNFNERAAIEVRRGINSTTTGNNSAPRGSGGGSGSNNGTRSFQNLPEIDVMGRDLGRRARAMPRQTGGLARSWDNLEKKTAIGPDLLGLEKALNGVAEVAARAEARAATQPPASRTLPINRTQTPVSTAPTKTIPTNMTRSMPVRVSSMNPAQDAPAQTQQTGVGRPVATSTPPAVTVPTPAPTQKTPPAQNPSWWSTPPKDLAAEQLRALHGIRDAIEKQEEKLEGLVGNSGNTTNPVTINQTVVQVGGKTTKAMTPEAKQLLESIKKGGAPALMTQNMRRILLENGVSNSDISQKPLGELLEDLKKKQS